MTVGLVTYIRPEKNGLQGKSLLIYIKSLGMPVGASPFHPKHSSNTFFSLVTSGTCTSNTNRVFFNCKTFDILFQLLDQFVTTSYNSNYLQVLLVLWVNALFTLGYTDAVSMF